MTKTYTLKYYEIFDHHAPEYNEKEYNTEEELRDTLEDLTFKSVRDVEVSVNFRFDDFYMEMYEA